MLSYVIFEKPIKNESEGNIKESYVKTCYQVVFVMCFLSIINHLKNQCYLILHLFMYNYRGSCVVVIYLRESMCINL